MKIKEHDCVVLTRDLPAENLQAGDVGAVVHIHKGGVAYEVEFVLPHRQNRRGCHSGSFPFAPGWPT